jgi:hypothetical protein
VASRRQIIANRRNAQKSTGPRTIAGKLRSRRNALRHGLTSETVITVFENAKDYEAFERQVAHQWRPQTEFHRQLVLRLCSLLWRLRRATAIETGLFQIQGQIIRERKSEQSRHESANNAARATLYEIFELRSDSILPTSEKRTNSTIHTNETSGDTAGSATAEQTPERHLASGTIQQPPQGIAQCFMRVARIDDRIFERLSRYEAALWRQVAQIVKTLSYNRN